MRNRKRTSLRNFLTRSLALGTAFMGGSLFATIDAADESGSPSTSSRRVAPSVVERSDRGSFSTRGSTTRQGTRGVDAADLQRAPLPFKPPVIVQSTPQSGTVAKPQTPESISGVWIPRSRAQSIIPGAENRFTPWTTPNIERAAPGPSLDSDPPSAKLNSPQSLDGLSGVVPNATLDEMPVETSPRPISNPPSLTPGPTQSDAVTSAPDTSDPAPLPPSLPISNSNDSVSQSPMTTTTEQTQTEMRLQTQARSESQSQTKSETRSQSQFETETTTETETTVQSRIAMLRETDESRNRSETLERAEQFEAIEPLPSLSAPAQMTPPASEEPQYEANELDEVETGLQAISEDALKSRVSTLSPVKREDSNEPIEDINESKDSDALAAEAKTDGDIDAESLERLRAAIRSFPSRRARQGADQALSPSDHDLESEETTESRQPAPLVLPRQPILIKPEVQAMRDSVARVLIDYYRRPENAAGRSPWGTFHLMLPFGADANIRSGNRLFNSIAWLSSNRPCRGQRLITTTQSGRIYVRQGPGLQGHRAQFLAMLAQVNVEASYPLTDGRNKFTVEDLIRAEMADCRTGEELTFVLIGLSHYLPTDTHWKASDGSTWNFEKLVAEELAQPIVGSACGGTHRLMGLSYALRQRRMEGLPIDGHWARAEAFINDFVEYAWTLQNRDGSFSTKWFEGPEDNRDIERKIQTTGHILEWLIFAADQQDLQDPRFVRSVQFLTNTFTRYRTREWDPGPKGHVLRALSVYHRRVYGDARPWATAVQANKPQPRTRGYR